MSHLLAFVRPDSSVAFVASMGVSEATSIIPMTEGLRCVVPPEGISSEELIAEWFHRDNWVKQTTQPSSFHKLNLDTYVWVDPRTLQDHKNAKWLEIKQARGVALDALLTTPYGVFDSHIESRNAILSAVVMLQTLQGLGTPSTIDFTLASNDVVTLSTSDMVSVGLALGEKVQASHNKGRTLRAQINAATTEVEVGSISW
jgi:hypothetical protein